MSRLLAAAAAVASNGVSMETPASLPADSIRKDGGTQMRSQISADTLNEYIALIRDNENQWPFRDKPVVYYDGSEYWLADGFHRHQAWIACTAADHLIPVEVRSGTRRDAVLYAAGANADHGLRRSSEDKRRAVLALLNDAEWSQWSNREIARRCKVDEKTVRTLRTVTPALTAGNPQLVRKYIDKHRNETIMKIPQRTPSAPTVTAENPQLESERLAAANEQERLRLRNIINWSIAAMPAYASYTGDNMTDTTRILVALVDRLDALKQK